MTSDLSIFAARLREFISSCADEPILVSEETMPALKAHHDAEFNGLALVLFALQFNHNAAYRKFCVARKCFPDSVTHWSEIPAMPTSAFKELELTSLPAAERTTIFHSSGTTEQRPSRHFHSAESLAVYESSLWPWFETHVLRPNNPEQSEIRNPKSAIILTPPPELVPHSSLAHMFETVRASAFGRTEAREAFAGEISGDGSWTLNFEKIVRTLNRSMADRSPVILLGTAFSFVHLLDHLDERNQRFPLPPGSRVMETGGYKGRSRTLPKAELHALITERLGVPASHIVCEYGMSELSSQAYDGGVSGVRCQVSGGDRIFHFPPWARAQVISPETNREVAEGETGLLRVFDLANVFSVLAIQTEDLAIRRGNGFELIGRAVQAEPRGCSLMVSDA